MSRAPEFFFQKWFMRVPCSFRKFRVFGSGFIGFGVTDLRVFF